MSTNSLTKRVRQIGKKYCLGGSQEESNIFCDTIANSVKMQIPYIFYKKTNMTVNEFWALKDLSLDLENREVIDINVRNDADKSTLLKILLWITAPTEKTIGLHGIGGSVADVDTGFHPDLTRRDNFFLSDFILWKKQRKNDQKFEEIAKYTEIEKLHINVLVKCNLSEMDVWLALPLRRKSIPKSCSWMSCLRGLIIREDIAIVRNVVQRNKLRHLVTL